MHGTLLAASRWQVGPVPAYLSLPAIYFPRSISCSRLPGSYLRQVESSPANFGVLVLAKAMEVERTRIDQEATLRAYLWGRCSSKARKSVVSLC